MQVAAIIIDAFGMPVGKEENQAYKVLERFARSHPKVTVTIEGGAEQETKAPRWIEVFINDLDVQEDEDEVS